MDNDKTKRLRAAMSLPSLLASSPYSNVFGPRFPAIKPQDKIRFKTCPNCGSTNKTLYWLPSHQVHVCLKCHTKLSKLVQPDTQNSIAATLTDEQREKLATLAQARTTKKAE